MNVKVEVEKGEGWRRTLSVVVPAEEAGKAYETVARQLGRKLKVPGFRKGKVPVSLVRKSFREELDREFVEDLLPRAFRHALTETDLDPVTEPQFADLSHGEDKPFSFEVAFECRPDIAITGHKGLQVEKEVPEVTDSHIDDVLEDFRKSRADLEDVTRESIAGDVLFLDYQAVDENDRPVPGRNVKGYRLELGAGQVMESFEEAVTGVCAGAVATAEVPYAADHSDPVLAGQTARYRIRVNSVQEKRFPELDDSLAAEHTDVTTVEELRAQVREELEAQAKRVAAERLEMVLLEQVVDANLFDPPAGVVEGLLTEVVSRARAESEQRGEDPAAIDEEALRTEKRSVAEREVVRTFVLELLARQEDLEVAREEVGERLSAMAQSRGLTPEQFKEAVGDPDFVQRFHRDLRDKKVLAFLVENAEITERMVPVGARPEA
ncbi:MAG: trigger factor [Gemmatimonadota bacterium]|nr:trigger factor [Gemmatimonadota bacterium]MDP6802989.1 trigger factor [Gemmatimonadota bacterium]MDP7032606.1 trigger factor [Gemmatimonadota bacterium]